VRLTTARLYLRPFTLADFDALRELDGDPAILHYRSRPEITPADTRAWLVQAEADAAHPDTSANPRRQYAFAATPRPNHLAAPSPLAAAHAPVLTRAHAIILVQLGLTRALTLAGEVSRTEAYLWYSTNRRHWGQGYAAEAARAVLKFGFEQVGLQRIFAECHPDNLASRRVMDKLGLRPEPHPPEEDARYPERAGYYRAALQASEWAALYLASIRAMR